MLVAGYLFLLLLYLLTLHASGVASVASVVVGGAASGAALSVAKAATLLRCSFACVNKVFVTNQAAWPPSYRPAHTHCVRIGFN